MDNINDIGRSISNSFGAGSIKDKIVSGIKYATEKLGVKLVAEEWGSTKGNDPNKFGCACALGCMILAKEKNLSEEDAEHNEKVAEDLLGVDNQWVTGFITGFDGGVLHEGSKEAYQIGKEIRNEFNIGKDDEEEYDDSDDEEDHF
jgi:hypothetical protein